MMRFVWFALGGDGRDKFEDNEFRPFAALSLLGCVTITAYPIWVKLKLRFLLQSDYDASQRPHD